MGFNSHPAVGQAKTGAAFSSHLSWDLAEPVEDFLEIVLGDADSGIGHLHEHETGLPGARLDLDAAAVAVELHGVRKEVHEHLKDLVAIAAH